MQEFRSQGAVRGRGIERAVSTVTLFSAWCHLLHHAFFGLGPSYVTSLSHRPFEVRMWDINVPCVKWLVL